MISLVSKRTLSQSTAASKNFFSLIIITFIALFLFSACGLGGDVSALQSTRGAHQEKIIGEKNLVAVDVDGSNVPAGLRPLLDGLGQLNIGCTVAHIGHGLVLTAGHCISTSPRSSSASCRLLGIVWGQRNGSQNLRTSKCESVLVRKYTNSADYALLKVSHPPEVSFKISFEPPQAARAATLLSFPRMRPMEWSGFCKMSDHPDSALKLQKFLHSCDTESGSSGAPVLDAETFEIIGVHGGAADDLNYGFFAHSMPKVSEFLKKYLEN